MKKKTGEKQELTFAVYVNGGYVGTAKGFTAKQVKHRIKKAYGCNDTVRVEPA